MDNNKLRQRRTPVVLSSHEHKRPHLLKGMEFTILVNRYDAVTPIGKERQEGQPPLPPEPWLCKHPARCWAVNARRPTSWRVSLGKMEIVAVPGSKSDRRVSPRPSLFTVCDGNIIAKNFIQLSNHKGEEPVSLFIRALPPHLDQSGGVLGTSFQEHIWGGHDRRWMHKRKW